eukprot:scaffold834_cov172-Amphora_coffeaeformis.AAC.10
MATSSQPYHAEALRRSSDDYCLAGGSQLECFGLLSWVKDMPRFSLQNCARWPSYSTNSHQRCGNGCAVRRSVH